MQKTICFLSLGSYPLLSSSEQLEYTGGAELMQVLISKELARAGYRVVFITFRDSNNMDEIIDGISILKSYSRLDGLSLFKRFRFIWQCLKKADADFYVHSSSFPGIAAIYCLINKKAFVNWVASDRNVLLRNIGKKNSILAKIALYIDIKLSRLILVQNMYQKKTLYRLYSKESILIKNPILITDRVSQSGNIGDYILWVGTIRSIKRPDIFLRLAKSLPEYNFLMVGGTDINESNLYVTIKEAAKSIPNLDFLGFVPHQKINKYYNNAIAVVNTSDAEGYPNVFLEAWMNYTPIISLNVDPDYIIRKYHLGYHSGSFENMIEDIKRIINNPQLRYSIGVNGRRYVEAEHDSTKIVNDFLDALNTIK